MRSEPRSLESLSALWIATIAEGVSVTLFLAALGVWCLYGAGRL